jgi:uncharacterized membrane protein
VKIAPEKLFLWFGTAFGLLFLMLTPPFQVPDEPNHFYRAWHISRGNLTADKKDNRVGGELPVSLGALVHIYEPMIWSPERFDAGGLLREGLAIDLNSDTVRFFDFNNTAAYPFVCYLPQAAGIFLARIFELPPLVSFYAARLLALFASLALIYTALRLIPVYRWLFAFIGLLPMSVYMNMSVSADVMTTGICLVFISYVVRLSRIEERAGKNVLLRLFILTALVCSIKMPYAPLAALILIIPATAFGGISRKIAVTGAAAALGLAIIYGWYAIADALYITSASYNPVHGPEACLPGGVDVKRQSEFLFSGMGVFRWIFVPSFISCVENHFSEFSGVFGWGNVKLLPFMNTAGYAFVLALAITDGHPRVLSLLARLLAALTGLLIFSLIVISMYLSWHWVGAPQVVAFQGRYLLPFYALFLFVFHNRLRTGRLPELLTVTGSAVLLVYGAWVLLNTYHIR